MIKVAMDGAIPRTGPRRRLTLAPGALSPATLGVGSQTAAGSRFDVLRERDEEEVFEAVDLAVRVAEDVLVEERAVSAVDVHRPDRSDAELAQEFWDFVGFPTKASRFWEMGSPVDDGADTQGTLSANVCRSPEVSSPELEAVAARARSCSPPAGRPRSQPTGRRRSVDGGMGRALRLPAVRLGWRGPLPRPRITDRKSTRLNSSHPV